MFSTKKSSETMQNLLKEQYQTFLEFESFSFSENYWKFTEFLAEWQSRLKTCREIGLEYTDLLLSLKLIKSLSISEEAQDVVFTALQTQTDPLDDILLQTMGCLAGLYGKCENTELEIKVESFEEANANEDLKITDLTEPLNTERLSFGADDYEDVSLEQEYDEYTEYNTDLETTLPPSQNKVKCEDKNLPNNHRKTRHEEKYKIEETPLDIFQCSLCPKIVESKFKLTRHVRWVHEKNLKCDKCDKLFYNKIHLNKHLEVHRRRELSGRGELPKDLKDLQCEKCGNHSETARKFRQHMRNHYPFSCSDCNSRHFLTQDNLQKHIEQHKQIPCDICGKVFTQQHRLTEHMKTASHGADKSLACDICGKVFYNKSNLLSHQKIHSERKHVCQVEGCDKAFIRNSLLNRHMITHTGEKSFKCEECGKMFGTKYRLKEHKERHAGQKKHPCTICDKAFFNKDKLNRHMRIHTGERPFQCDKCAKSFIQSKDLKKHILTH